MSKKILITGGAGFIGSNLCERLLNEGNSVICVDNLYSGRLENIQNFLNHPNFQFINHDITEPLKLTGLDQIYNLACPASPPSYQKDPIFTWKTSVFGIFNVLELARANGNIPILQSSTSEIYGDPLEHPQKETYKGNVNPIGIRACYDEGKRAAEALIFDYNRIYDTPVRVIRIFNTYGPNMDPEDGRVVTNFIKQALKNEDITIYGNGNQTRSFQYIDDLINGLILMMNNETNFIGPINLGNPEEFTIKELADIVLKLLPDSTSKIISQPIPQDDPKQRKPDITQAKEILNWSPKIPLQEGLKKTIIYMTEELKVH